LSFKLAQAKETEKTSTTTTTTTYDSGDEYGTIGGPISLRSANTMPVGELEVKNIFGWSMVEGHGDGEWSYEFELEYGLAEDHELLFEIPAVIGDGRIEGNADAELGWHWRLVHEDGGVPAIAIRNFLRIPSGVDSSGMEYTLKALATWTLVEDVAHLHLNPYIKQVCTNNGGDEEAQEDLVYGGSFGIDYALSEDLTLITDYRYDSEVYDYAPRGNHAVEVGLDWDIAENQTIGFVTEAGVDGDEWGTHLGAKVSYILSFGG